MSKATLYLDDSVHKALRLKAAETRMSMSDLVNDALKEALREDLEDISDWKARKKEKTISYDELLSQLKEDGTL
ncbi:ribbon-helix-helix protein, CopG family [Coraliomargarita parva]|uniref:ribbon-helix-helix protein, CopG family n=1 Tax=Coraliomargarita parva TaxID=3014050 RepID=UPI0022B5B875|nr:ribbon-helix-helix protein, CopG family [Coraliomargarita parva]